MRAHAAWTAVAATLFLALVAVILRLAWISDDAYITLRTVENWVAGHGPNWNIDERVQTYTHPLWMLLLSLGRRLTGEHYYTTIFLGVVTSLATALLLLRIARGAVAAAAVLSILIWSRAFGDFATSGLETPLVFLLSVLLALVVPSELPPLRKLSLSALLTGLAATTRMDLIVLFAPALLACARGLPRLQALGRIVLGMSPFTAWLVFATIYYGTPFPITAYAKAIAVGIDPFDLLRQGCWYFVYVLATDPLSMGVIALGCGLGFALPQLRCRMLALGVLLYCGYVVKVGGDFMSGRFFAPPFVAALTIVAYALRFATAHQRWRAAVGSLVGAPALAFLASLSLGELVHMPSQLPPFLRPPAADQPPTTVFHGIIDERCFYYWQLGLFAPAPTAERPAGKTIPVYGGLSAYLRALGRKRPAPVSHGQVGRYGFEAGDLIHFIDPWLCDPLLMRLPVWDVKGWRIGHFIRRIPEGYFETIATGTNKIVHPGLRRYYDALQTVISAPVFGEERLPVLWDMLRGKYDGDLATYVAEDQDNCYRKPLRVRVPAQELRNPQPPTAPWFDLPLARILYAGGIAVLFDQPQQGAKLTLQVTGNIAYRLQFFRGDEACGTLTGEAKGAFGGDPFLRELVLDVPPEAKGFTSVWMDAINPTSENVGCVGSVIVGS